MDQRIKSAWAEWEITYLLGEGSYGKVYKAVKKDFGAEMHSAIKIITIPKSLSELKALRANGMSMDESRTYLAGVVNSLELPFCDIDKQMVRHSRTLSSLLPCRERQ